MRRTTRQSDTTPLLDHKRQQSSKIHPRPGNNKGQALVVVACGLIAAFAAIFVLYTLAIGAQFKYRYNFQLEQVPPSKYEKILPPFMDSIPKRIAHNTRVWDEAAWDNEFTCKGFVAVNDCGEPSAHAGIMQPNCAVEHTGAGFCVFEHKPSGKVVSAMHNTCHTPVSGTGAISCDMARQFLNYKVILQHAHELADKANIPNCDASNNERGIVVTAREQEVNGVYSMIRMLRDQGSTLPVELWLDDHMRDQENQNVFLVRLSKDFGISIRFIDFGVQEFMAKPYAIYNSKFRHVLLLDTDNTSMRDPSYLFDTAAYKSNGAILFPDYWDERNSPFGFTHDNMVWELLGFKPNHPLEAESGQMLVDKCAHAKSIEVLFQMSKTFHDLIGKIGLVYGDKELYRFAFRVTGEEYHFINHPPTPIGIEMNNEDHFCGQAMVQYDPNGKPIFVHRNQLKPFDFSKGTTPMTKLQLHESGLSDYYVKMDWKRSSSGVKMYSDGYCYNLYKSEAKLLTETEFPELFKYEQAYQKARKVTEEIVL